MRYSLAIIMIIIGLLGCLARTPQPVNLPEISTHEYTILVKDPDGVPVQGANVKVEALDFSKIEHDTTRIAQEEATYELISDKDGVCKVRVPVRLYQHFKNYYTTEADNLLRAQADSKDSYDVWGYLSQIRVAGGLSDLGIWGNREIQVVFHNKPSPLIVEKSIVIEVPFKNRPKDFQENNNHKYQFIAQDKNGAVVKGATVTLKLINNLKSPNQSPDEAKPIAQYDCITDGSGACSIVVPVKLKHHVKGRYLDLSEEQLRTNSYRLQAVWGYLTQISASGRVDDFVSGKPAHHAMFNTDLKPLVADVPIILEVPLPKDYYCETLKSPQQSSYADALSKWVLSIQNLGDIQGAYLQEICSYQFKNKEYATLKLIHKYKFNSLKLNDYEIGVRIFDDIVRKMTRILSDVAKDFPFDGYMLEIKTYKENFIRNKDDFELFEDSENKNLNFQFFMPKQQVNLYKNADITGQQLIDSSIILLNNERIGLRLQ